MILSGRHGDCPHCGGSLSDVREVNLSPGRDMDLMWLLAGHKTEKMKLKKYVDERCSFSFFLRLYLQNCRSQATA